MKFGNFRPVKDSNKRCLLCRKPYRDKTGSGHIRMDCPKECKHNYCTLTKQPVGVCIGSPRK